MIKIVTFWKNEEFKSLVQMESIDQAQAAQQALDGRDIYTGCNTLNIVFSRHPELRVRFNNDRSWDYTSPSLPPGPVGNEGSFEMSYDDMPAQGMLGDVPDGNMRGEAFISRAEEQEGHFHDRNDGRFEARGPHRDRNVPDRFEDGPLGPGYILPPHSTGRSLRADKRRSPVLICSNMDEKLVVSVLFLYTRA